MRTIHQTQVDNNTGMLGTRFYIGDLSTRELIREARLLHQLTTGKRFEIWPRRPLPVAMRPRWGMVRAELARRRRLPGELLDTCPSCAVVGRWWLYREDRHVVCIACGAGRGKAA